jgi:transcriptional regulator with XRE-family HTH domain
VAGGYSGLMSVDSEIADFLRARRAATRPEDVGIDDPGRRRVPGLRREELARLAGVSVEYYTRLEQGRDRHPSALVLQALAKPLGIDDDALEYLRRLAEPAPRRQRERQPEMVRPEALQLLKDLAAQPALIIGRYRDVLAATDLACAVCPGFVPGHNILRYVFLDPAAPDIYGNWAEVAAEAVRTLRVAIGSDVDDVTFTELVGELSIKSEDFQTLWSRHEVAEKTIGAKHFRNPIVGELRLEYQSLTLNGTDGQTLSVYHAPPGSPAEQSLTLLRTAISPGSLAPHTHHELARAAHLTTKE